MDEIFIVGISEINSIFELFFSWYIEVFKYIKVNYGIIG